MSETRILVSLPQHQIDILDELARQGAFSSRNALIQQIVAAFISDLRDKRTNENPAMLQSALGALVGGILFGLGLAVVAKLFGGDK